MWETVIAYVGGLITGFTEFLQWIHRIGSIFLPGFTSSENAVFCSARNYRHRPSAVSFASKHLSSALSKAKAARLHLKHQSSDFTGEDILPPFSRYSAPCKHTSLDRFTFQTLTLTHCPTPTPTLT
ncbi:hypothetical protein LX36DRAFT_315932 [Colletotrichum falcatum]|nr:hypothetical protein LX36DRAFT_315932 [Colletotrichum falcatum]